MIDKVIKKNSITPIEPDFMCDISFFEDVFKSNPLDSCVILVKKNFFGDEENELTKNLLISFFSVMVERDIKPSTFIFMSNGIPLVCKESKISDYLEKLVEDGISIMVCEKSLKYYGLKEKMEVGFISTMHDICEILLKSSKIINL